MSGTTIRMDTYIAAFDFDGTITKGDTMLPFIRHARGTCGLLRALLIASPWMVAWKMGLYSRHSAKQRLFAAAFKGMPINRFYTLGRTFARHHSATMLRSGAVTEIARHHALEHHIVVVTASMEAWVRPMVLPLGINHIIGTTPETNDKGQLTGRFLTPNCHGTEKVRRLTAALPHLSQCTLEAYGDSSGDRELLAAAQVAHYRPFR